MPQTLVGVEWQDRGGPGQQVAAQTVHRVELEKEDRGPGWLTAPTSAPQALGCPSGCPLCGRAPRSQSGTVAAGE